MTDIVKAYRKIIILTYPTDMVDKPLLCNLTRLHDVTFNILKAQISPRKEGYMTIELTGSEENCKNGISYLKEQGVKISNAAHKISRNEDCCVHCGLCTAVCSNESLCLDPETRKITFDMERCTACGLCVRICPVRAMNTELENGQW
jgi:ferredoxin